MGMERRSHRIAVLSLVVLLHLPALFAIRAWMAPMPASPAPTQALRVEFVLNAEAPPPPPPPMAPRPVPLPSDAAPSPPSVRGAPAANPRVETETRLRDAPEERHVRLFADDGSLRLPANLAQEIAPRIEAPRDDYHLPAGDDWVLREPESPIAYEPTRFAEGYMPEDMNPVEEACWRNKALAFALASLGSTDCAAPGRKKPRPTPAMIVYGEDDGEDILRKTEAWERYNE